KAVERKLLIQKNKELEQNKQTLTIQLNYLNNTLQEVNDNYIQANQEIQDLQQELKGEKQLSQKQKTAYLAKIKHLQTLLNKPKLDKEIQTELETIEKETQTITDYEKIIQQEREKNKKLKSNYQDLQSDNNYLKKENLQLAQELDQLNESLARDEKGKQIQ